MQNNDHLSLPSAHSAFSRPRQRYRPNIEPSPNICRNLSFGGVNSGNDVTRTLRDVTHEEHEMFSTRWKNKYEGIPNKQDSAEEVEKKLQVEKKLPASDWIPILLSSEAKSNMLKNFETVDFNPYQRPTSPIPFLNQSSPNNVSPTLLNASSSLKAPSCSTTVPRISSADIFSRNGSSFPHSASILSRSLSDPLSRSSFRTFHEGGVNNRFRWENGVFKGWLTPPCSPPQERIEKLPSASSKTRQLRLTDVYQLRKGRAITKRVSPEFSSLFLRRGKRRKTWSE